MRTSIAVLFLFILLVNISIAQDQDQKRIFTKTNFGLFGGVNLSNQTKLGGAAQFEFKTDLLENLFVKVSAAYYNTTIDVNQDVKSYSTGEIGGEEYFAASEYSIIRRRYQSIPLSFGLQYFLKQSDISPYILTEVGYNLIDAKADLTPAISYSYNSLEEIPPEYKQHTPQPLPLSSFRYGFGIGTTYRLSDFLALDLRYIFLVDTEIVNTHQILFGIVF